MKWDPIICSAPSYVVDCYRYMSGVIRICPLLKSEYLFFFLAGEGPKFSASMGTESLCFYASRRYEN
jgi:hypothetical protein